MKQRALLQLLKNRLLSYPAVVLVGPRQSGKTTLSKSVGGLYFDLEKEIDQIRLEATWDDVLTSKVTVILDEAQNYPRVFPHLRAAIDEDRKRMGRFLLLGSIAPSLMKEVGESLAGRMAICELTPFLAPELPATAEFTNWALGGFPDGGILRPKAFPAWEENYLQLLAQRDLPLWGLPAKPAVTLRLFKMLAALHGQNWNASEVGGSLGLTYHTVNSYMDYLVGAFLIRMLPPFHANIRKRLVKSPKVYWRDSGLLHSLLGIRTTHSKGVQDELLNQPWVGRSFEGWVIEQVLSSLQSLGISVEGSFFRTNDGKELDLVLEAGNQLWAIEIKLSSDPDSGMSTKLNEAANLIGASHRLLISKTRKPFQGRNFWSTDLRGAIRVLRGCLEK